MSHAEQRTAVEAHCTGAGEDRARHEECGQVALERAEMEDVIHH